MDTVLLVVVAAASLVAIWFFCLRPMRQGRCGMSGGAGNGDAQLQRQIAELQEEIRMLRAQDALAEDRPAKRDRDG